MRPKNKNNNNSTNGVASLTDPVGLRLGLSTSAFNTSVSVELNRCPRLPQLCV